jgi:diacylglycerol kinase
MKRLSRQEALAAIVLLPLAFWFGQSWVETALLVGTVILVMVVELLNTGIESAIDRIGPEWHELQNARKTWEAPPYCSACCYVLAFGLLPYFIALFHDQFARFFCVCLLRFAQWCLPHLRQSRTRCRPVDRTTSRPIGLWGRQ